jgi:two-component system phosphate regulon sensor histidine kinase PhoR
MKSPSTEPVYTDIISPASPQFRVYCAAINGEQTDSDNFIVVIQDITEAIKYEQLRKDFVANVSHELRTPLTFIKGYVEALRGIIGKNADKTEEFLKVIERNIQQLTNLVEDLLELSRLESRQGIVRIRSTDINKLIEQVIETFKPAISKKNHNVITKIPADIMKFHADPDLLGKAISNLIGNAIKYTSENGQITIEVKQREANMEIEITDNGIGMAEEDLPRIFERFYRADKSRSREMGGTGLGLAIVKHIVQLHHGEISVQSKLGSGSKFIITLPIIPPDSI